jgi:arginase
MTFSGGDRLMQRKYEIIGAASGWGAQVRGCEDGPDFLKNQSSSNFLGTEIESWETLYPEIRFKEKNISLAECFDLIIRFNRRLAERVSACLKRGHFPIVLGGDHGNALGTWNGVGDFLSQQEGSFGLLWIDAHMDSHTPETTLSGAWHGMPLAGLLGRGHKAWAELKRKEPILKPKHVCLIGIRSFEEGEEELLKDLNVRVYFIDEVKKRGLQEVIKEATSYVNQGTCGYGVSLDVDVVDPSEAPGTASQVSDGITARALLEGLSLISSDERLKAFELVEFNPHLDECNKTFHLCQEVLKQLTLQESLCAR